MGISVGDGMDLVQFLRAQLGAGPEGAKRILLVGLRKRKDGRKFDQLQKISTEWTRNFTRWSFPPGFSADQAEDPKLVNDVFVGLNQAQMGGPWAEPSR